MNFSYIHNVSNVNVSNVNVSNINISKLGNMFQVQEEKRKLQEVDHTSINMSCLCSP